MPPVECGLRTDAGRYGANRAFSIDNVLVFTTSELRVDADGAPDAYRVDGKGLSYTCDGIVAIENGVRYTHRSHPDTWQEKCKAAWAKATRTGDYSGVDIFGFETTSQGIPRIQNAGDPLPGEAYITTTSVTIPGQPSGTQRRYVNSSEIPFVVLPGNFVNRHSIAAGAVAAVYRPGNEHLVFAVYGDSGGALNEASIRLHQELGSDPMIVRGGVRRAKRNINDLIVVAVFPQIAPSRTLDSSSWRTAINHQGRQAFDAWSGLPRLQACAQLG